MVCDRRSTRTPARSADTARPATLGSPSRAARNAWSTPAPSAASTRSASSGEKVPSTRSQPSNVRRRAGCSPGPTCRPRPGPRCRCRRPRRASGGWRAGSPRRPRRLPVPTRSLRARPPARGDGGRTRRARGRAPWTAAPLGPRRRRRAAGPAPHPAAGDRAARPSRPRPLRRPGRRRQRALGRPAAALFESLQQCCGQRVHGVQQLLGLEDRRAQLLIPRPLALPPTSNLPSIGGPRSSPTSAGSRCGCSLRCGRPGRGLVARVIRETPARRSR